MLASVSCADLKFVTLRVGIPMARRTERIQKVTKGVVFSDVLHLEHLLDLLVK